MCKNASKLEVLTSNIVVITSNIVVSTANIVVITSKLNSWSAMVAGPKGSLGPFKGPGGP